MKLQKWDFTVQVTVDLDAIGQWTPSDVTEAIDSTVSQLEGVANDTCQDVSAPKGYVACVRFTLASPAKAVKRPKGAGLEWTQGTRCVHFYSAVEA
jgi:hypothetical protein